MRYKNKKTRYVCEMWQWNGERIAYYDKSIPIFVFKALKRNLLGLTGKNTVEIKSHSPNLASRKETNEYFEGLDTQHMKKGSWLSENLKIYTNEEFLKLFEIF